MTFLRLQSCGLWIRMWVLFTCSVQWEKLIESGEKVIIDREKYKLEDWARLSEGFSPSQWRESLTLPPQASSEDRLTLRTAFFKTWPPDHPGRCERGQHPVAERSGGEAPRQPRLAFAHRQHRHLCQGRSLWRPHPLHQVTSLHNVVLTPGPLQVLAGQPGQRGRVQLVLLHHRHILTARSQGSTSRDRASQRWCEWLVLSIKLIDKISFS